MKKILTLSFLIFCLKIGACEKCIYSMMESLDGTSNRIKTYIDDLPKEDIHLRHVLKEFDRGVKFGINEAFEIIQYYHPELKLTFKEYEKLKQLKIDMTLKDNEVSN